MTFGKKLDAALDSRGSLCVGIDPHPGLLEQWGLPVDGQGLATFSAICVAAFADLAPVIKPQSAFFEQHGAEGIAVLEGTIAASREAGALVVLDVKRGDIGSTMIAYADAYLDPASALAADAITLSPYLGVGTLEPAFELCTRHDAGAFVLALTSNAEARAFQTARVDDGRMVAQVVLDDLAARNAGTTPMGSLGAVVGATIGTTEAHFDALNGPILSPGVGAQGGKAEDVRRLFGDALPHVVPSVSREVLRQGPDIESLRTAVEQLRDQFTFLRA